jgi:hypothetical protein
VAVRKFEIQKDDVRMFRDCEIHAMRQRARIKQFDIWIQLFQKQFQSRSEECVVVDEQYTHATLPEDIPR